MRIPRGASARRGTASVLCGGALASSLAMAKEGPPPRSLPKIV